MSMIKVGGTAALLSVGMLGVVGIAEALEPVSVSRDAARRYALTWASDSPVDVYVSDLPTAPVSQMRLISTRDADGQHVEVLRNLVRPYFALVDRQGKTVRVAERLLPLQGASNFRDLGGYPAANGKTVRWGALYRSGAMSRLTEADYDYLSALDIRVLCDLRSREEVELTPTDWQADTPVRYLREDYPAEILFGRITRPPADVAAGQPARSIYVDFPEMLRPQFRAMFASLIGGEAPLTVNCSAGQDRTGLASALILTALGVPRDDILRDYHLSTVLRSPDNEWADADYDALAEKNVVARFLADRLRAAEGDGKAAFAPRPLYNAEGEALLMASFSEIEAQYGSVAAYLDRALGVNADAIATLRALYTE